MTCIQWIVMWAMFEVACIPIVLLLGRAMYQNGREQESEQL